MTFVWGAVLAAGILLVLSPWLWPKRETPDADAAEVPAAAPLPIRRIVVSGVGAVVAGAIAWLLAQNLALVLVAAGVAGAAPTLWVRARRARTLRARRAMWPDVCDLLIASVRSGMSLPDSVASLAESAPAELRPAFATFARDVAASGHFDSAALHLKDTLADPIADRIIESLRMARQVGGTELTSILRSLSASVRAETAVRAEVEARQSWIRGAAVLSVTAPWIILVLLALRPEGAAAYSTPTGLALIVGGALISFVAFRIMLRVGRLPEPRRWFG